MIVHPKPRQPAAPLFIRAAPNAFGLDALMLVDDQGRIIAGQVSGVMSRADDVQRFTAEFVVGMDVVWEGQPTPHEVQPPQLVAALQAWGDLSPANRARFMTALGLAVVG